MSNLHVILFNIKIIFNFSTQIHQPKLSPNLIPFFSFGTFCAILYHFQLFLANEYQVAHHYDKLVVFNLPRPILVHLIDNMFEHRHIIALPVE